MIGKAARPRLSVADEVRRSAEVEALATELSRVRQRGIDHLELATKRQRSVSTPLLERLAAAASDAAVADRIVLLRHFLDGSLTTYGTQRPDEAKLLRSLLFDQAGRSPGPSRPTGLLRDTRRVSGLSEEAFRKLQREYFVDFARRLLTPPPRRRAISERLRRSALAVVATLVALLALVAVLHSV
jgi:hypothetical protein